MASSFAFLLVQWLALVVAMQPAHAQAPRPGPRVTVWVDGKEIVNALLRDDCGRERLLDVGAGRQRVQRHLVPVLPVGVPPRLRGGGQQGNQRQEQQRSSHRFLVQR